MLPNAKRVPLILRNVSEELFDYICIFLIAGQPAQFNYYS